MGFKTNTKAVGLPLLCGKNIGRSFCFELVDIRLWNFFEQIIRFLLVPDWLKLELYGEEAASGIFTFTCTRTLCTGKHVNTH
jgi:hypothetical protein